MNLLADSKAVLVNAQREIRAETVTLRGSRYDDLEITAVSVGRAEGTRENVDTGIMSERSITVRLRPADITGSIGDWDTMVVDGDEWAIVSPPMHQDDVVITLQCVRNSAQEISRGGYRRS